ncbi:hypothetical protein ACFL2H_13905, partial [Planctomycetota bacterium]
MFSTDVITDRNQVTTDYVSCVFNHALETQNRVVAVREIVNRDSATGAVAAFEVNWKDDSDQSVPHRVFLKVADVYNGKVPWELIVYRDLLTDTPNLPLVRCFDGCFDATCQKYHLLLEDVSMTHRAMRSGLPPTFAESQGVVSALAAFHKRWWGSETMHAQ